MTTDYNGWTNWETWAVNLHLTNDYNLYRKLVDFADMHKGQATTKEWRRFTVANLRLSTIERKPIDMSAVNWQELAENLNSYHEGE